MIRRLNTHCLHAPKRLQCLIRFILVCQHLQVESEVALSVLSLIEEGLEAAIEMLHEGIGGLLTPVSGVAVGLPEVLGEGFGQIAGKLLF
jgi:hypothetical protein